MNKVKGALLLLTCLVSGLYAFSQTIDTTCINLIGINSANDEYLPFFMDSTLLFTSNRKSTLEGQTLEFTEKVYLSNKKDGKWSVPKKVGYKWNSDNNTALVGVSLKSYFFYRSYWKDNGEIFIASRKEDTLKSMKAEHLQKVKPICSEYDENSVTTIKEDTFYFVSNRNGNYDIFMQTGSSKAVPVDILNSPYNEQDVFLTGDGKTLYFSSDRPGGKGGYDIYRSDKINNQWSSPVPLQSKYINTAADDRDFRWYNDSTMFLSSNRDGGLGGFDIYEITVKKTPALNIDTIPPEIIDTTPLTLFDTIPPEVVDTVKHEETELIEQLKKLGLYPFKGELQLGAYRYIKSIAMFKKAFSCLDSVDMRLDSQNIEGVIVYKFIINKVYTDIDEILNEKANIVKRNCLPTVDFQDIPFIAMLDKNGNRFCIFWKKDEFENKTTFNIFSNGKPVWKGRRF